ncbi:hypothetical protein M409DRAFT_21167 [Zasmidium cellare ATCC 36951]|uniref:Uncharacterized protein n=1 Tax=Zasmidium cellare ATCC 36951 TaxID=1080233 RepID=A0A6A6CME9_ZASCE|nr:uncharacterized protein M409DRAFT_21167 [Zasmidium cellare ATCC 36951]KAF2168417.1 hypothetical protein M409DRAFT_21167 [Zasmidium cellare ATCC 36951]
MQTEMEFSWKKINRGADIRRVGNRIERRAVDREQSRGERNAEAREAKIRALRKKKTSTWSRWIAQLARGAWDKVTDNVQFISKAKDRNQHHTFVYTHSTSLKPAFTSNHRHGQRHPQDRALYKERHDWADRHEEDVAGVKDLLERAAAGVTVSLAIPAKARLMLVLREVENMAKLNNKTDWANTISLLHTRSRGRARRLGLRETMGRRRVLVEAVICKNVWFKKLLDDTVIWALRSALFTQDLSIGQP